jgi:hypothetical protein
LTAGPSLIGRPVPPRRSSPAREHTHSDTRDAMEVRSRCARRGSEGGSDPSNATCRRPEVSGAARFVSGPWVASAGPAAQRALRQCLLPQPTGVATRVRSTLQLVHCVLVDPYRWPGTDYVNAVMNGNANRPPVTSAHMATLPAGGGRPGCARQPTGHRSCSSTPPWLQRIVERQGSAAGRPMVRTDASAVAVAGTSQEHSGHVWHEAAAPPKGIKTRLFAETAHIDGNITSSLAREPGVRAGRAPQRVYGPIYE